jgi:hypothetical protein
MNKLKHNLNGFKPKYYRKSNGQFTSMRNKILDEVMYLISVGALSVIIALIFILWL